MQLGLIGLGRMGGNMRDRITRAGHDRLKAELDELWRAKRPEVVKALAAAAAEGDRSENAEYT